VSFKAILFDLDGTLLDTLDDLADSMNMVLAARGYEQHTVEEYRYLVGYGVPELVRRSLPEHEGDDAGLVDQMSLELREHYSKRWAQKTRPYPGVLEMLARIEAMGIEKSVFSNKPDEFTKMTVRHFLGKFDFSVVLGIKDGIPPKPNPKGALYVASLMGIEPGEFLYLGDTGTDMQTAREAGMYPAGVLWGFRDRDELERNKARSLLGSPSDLFDLNLL